jgi:hypothetical protein
MDVDDPPGRRIDTPPEAEGLVCREDRAGRFARENELCLVAVLHHLNRILSQAALPFAPATGVGKPRRRTAHWEEAPETIPGEPLLE